MIILESRNKEKQVDALINLVVGKGDTNENDKEYIMHLIPVFDILVLAILSIVGWVFYVLSTIAILAVVVVAEMLCAKFLFLL